MLYHWTVYVTLLQGTSQDIMTFYCTKVTNKRPQTLVSSILNVCVPAVYSLAATYAWPFTQENNLPPHNKHGHCQTPQHSGHNDRYNKKVNEWLLGDNHFYLINLLNNCLWGNSAIIVIIITIRSIVVILLKIYLLVVVFDYL